MVEKTNATRGYNHVLICHCRTYIFRKSKLSLLGLERISFCVYTLEDGIRNKEAAKCAEWRGEGGGGKRNLWGFLRSHRNREWKKKLHSRGTLRKMFKKPLRISRVISEDQIIKNLKPWKRFILFMLYTNAKFYFSLLPLTEVKIASIWSQNELNESCWFWISIKLFLL